MFFYYSMERLINKFRRIELKYNAFPYFNDFKIKFAVKYTNNRFVQIGLDLILSKKTNFVCIIDSLFKKRKNKHFLQLIDSIKSKYLSDTLIKNQKVRII